MGTGYPILETEYTIPRTGSYNSGRSQNSITRNRGPIFSSFSIVHSRTFHDHDVQNLPYAQSCKQSKDTSKK